MPNLTALRGGVSLVELSMRMKTTYVDAPMLSKIERGHALPSVALMPKFEAAYGAPRDVLFDPAELDFGLKAAATPPKPDAHKRTRRKSFRLVEGVATALPDALTACGYTTAQSWFDACVRHLFAQQSILQKAQKNAAPPALTREAVAKENNLA